MQIAKGIIAAKLNSNPKLEKLINIYWRISDKDELDYAQQELSNLIE